MTPLLACRPLGYAQWARVCFSAIDGGFHYFEGLVRHSGDGRNLYIGEEGSIPNERILGIIYGEPQEIERFVP